ncbi:outer membrane lipoprotein-sorting protein [Lewinella aquimaris]|uniref:Outer membrane lipoprotein-sorting protein n=1 Tax=Neolewinella aquimaris TaxID=1835722 RepID=A0A840E1I5_9BACT|nr:outer membrane lipoprotein carrier protein LolA [Neolewinella aquimaris]MBB4079071.1 outer membrane lipoprotein-sorting protein [Neolewinella aquimaris]
MKAILITLSLLIAFLPLSAQDGYYGKASDSDPAAKQILEQIRDKYDGFNTLAANFRLELQFPGQPAEIQRGTLSRQGDLVRFKLGDQEGIINKEAAYFILHASKEVQINDLPAPGETTGMLTPQNLFSFYEGDQYIFALQGEEVQDGNRLMVIEMKPVDRNASDFTKLRLLVDDKRKEIVSVRAFSRDGSTYAFFLDTPRGNAPLADGTFTFSKAEFPGYHVEDLRF